MYKPDEEKAGNVDMGKPKKDYISEIQMNMQGTATLHRVVPITKSGARTGVKPCDYCKRHGLRTINGHVVLARKKCDTCNLPFCVKLRGCFLKHHEDMLSNAN